MDYEIDRSFNITIHFVSRILVLFKPKVCEGLILD